MKDGFDFANQHISSKPFHLDSGGRSFIRRQNSHSGGKLVRSKGDKNLQPSKPSSPPTHLEDICNFS